MYGKIINHRLPFIEYESLVHALEPWGLARQQSTVEKVDYIWLNFKKSYPTTISSNINYHWKGMFSSHLKEKEISSLEALGWVQI